MFYFDFNFYSSLRPIPPYSAVGYYYFTTTEAHQSTDCLRFDVGLLTLCSPSTWISTKHRERTWEELCHANGIAHFQTSLLESWILRFRDEYSKKFNCLEMLGWPCVFFGSASPAVTSGQFSWVP